MNRCNWCGIGLIVCLAFLSIAITTERSAAQSAGEPRNTVLADFKAPVLSKIAVGKGVSIARIDDNSVELRIAPFKEHGNQWPLIAFGPNYFGDTVNLAGFSRLELKIDHQSEGMLAGHVGITTSPDATRAVDEESFMIPGHNAVTTKLALNALKFNDPSQISVIQIVFRPRETETVIRLEAIRGVYDPATGSPADDLMRQLALAKKHVAQLKDSPSLRELQKKFAALEGDINRQQAIQFHRSLRSLSQKMNEMLGELGRQHFTSAGPMWMWEADRYSPITRKAGPSLEDEALKRISVSMAGNEYRDFVFAVSASESDLSLDVSLAPTGSPPLPAEAVDIRVLDYRTNRQGDSTGDVLLPVDGRIAIPQGESRQLWVRFNTRSMHVAPGTYPFELVLRDDARQLLQRVPGKLEVWNFSLPSYDILANNSYAEFPSSNFPSGEAFANAVRHMKMYGLNQIFVHPVEMPRPKGLDEKGQITGYDDAALRSRITEALAAWKNAPGDESLHFIFSISGFEELGLKREGYAFPNEQWKAAFSQWLGHLKSVIADAGLKNDQWMMVLRDESGEPALMQVEIPLAEVIKRIDPSIKITCNASVMLADSTWTKRYFAAFDVFQPHLGRDETLNWLRGSGKTLWVYQCECDLASIGRDLYSYNRVYGWDLLDKGFVGTGLWTYSAQAPANWDEPGQGCLLVYNHPQRGLVHSPRYEMFREGIDDYRYVKALRIAAEKKGPEATANANRLIAEAVKDVTTNRADRVRCEKWRMRIAKELLALH